MNTPLIEAIKEIYRWFYSYVLAKLLEVGIGFLVSALPFFPVYVFPKEVAVLGWVVPLQLLVANVVIPAIIRGLDKYKFIQSKEKVRSKDEPMKGLFGFNLLNNWM